MQRSPSLLWIVLILIVILPSAAGRILIDIAGGLLVLSIILPIILGGAGWLGWKYLKTKMVGCEACGINTFGNNDKCGICGANLKVKERNLDDGLDASAATIDIKVEDYE